MAERSAADNAASSQDRDAALSADERQRKSATQQRNDRSAWNWLLVPAIVIPLLVPLYNRVEPTLFGWPFFYWVQIAFIALGVATTSVVYQKTKTRRPPQADRRGTTAGSIETER